MTPAQQSALEALAGRALDAADVAAIDPLLPNRNDVAIAAALSVGRVKLVEHRVSELGVRRALGVVLASRLLTVLKTAAVTHEAGGLDAWLVSVLTGLGVPAEDHDAYQETIGSAWRWLTQPEGLDIADATTRDLLDVISAGNPTLAGACATLKAAGEQPDPIHFNRVSDALNIAEGRRTL